MSKKNKIFSTLVLLLFIFACALSVSPIKIGVEDNQTDEPIATLSTPKSSFPTSFPVSKVWNYSSEGVVGEVAVSADGGYVASVGDDDGSEDDIWFFNTSAHNGKPMMTWINDLPFKTVAISADGNYYVAGTYEENYVFLFNKTDMIWYVDLSDDDCWIYSVDISADGQYIVVGGEWDDGFDYYGFVAVYDNTPPSSGLGDDKYGEELWEEYGFEGDAVESVAISADGRYVVAGSVYNGGHDWDNSLFLFNATDGDPLWSFDANDNIDEVAISADGSYIAAGSSNNEYGFLLNNSIPDGNWDDKEPIWYFDLQGEPQTVDISADGKWVVFGLDFDGGDGIVVALDNSYNSTGGQDKADEHAWHYESDGIVNSVSITADGKYIVAGTEYDPGSGQDYENTVFLFYNPRNIGGERNLPNWYYNTSDHVHSVSISAYGNYFAVGGESTSGETLLFYHARREPPIPLPSPDRGDDDDDEDTGFIVIVIIIIVIASVGIGVFLIVVLIKKGVLFGSKSTPKR